MTEGRIGALRFVTFAVVAAAALAAGPAAPLTSKKIALEVNLPLAKQLGARVTLALLESATRIIT